WLSSAKGLDLAGVGPGTWECLVDAGYLTGLLDWLDAATLPATCGSKLTVLLHPAKGRSFHQWLRALGMPPTGGAPLPDQWLALATRTEQQWQTQPGIGPHRARQLVAFFHHPQEEWLRARLAAAGVEGFVEEVASEQAEGASALRQIRYRGEAPLLQVGRASSRP